MKEVTRLSSQPLVSDFLIKVLPSPKRLCQVLTVIVVGLTLASLAGQLYRYWPGHNQFLLHLANKFNLNGEANVPTWYQSSTLFLSSLLLWLIASAKRVAGARYLWHWRALALIFMYLSLDEAACIHEQANKLGPALHASGFFYFVWVIPAAILVSIFVLAYLGFLAHLSPRDRWLFVIAGAIYVGGALGMEMVGGAYMSSHGEIMEGAQGITYAVITTIEEFMEMAGIVVFIYVLLAHLRAQVSAQKTQMESIKTILPMVKVRAAS